MDLSLVIPVFNEEGNVLELHTEIKRVLDNISAYFKRLNRPDLGKQYKNYEIIFVDDGSTDSTFLNLLRIRDKHLKIIKFRRNFGQSAALKAGIDHSRGRVIVTMDGDLQNDPLDIPRLLARLSEGCDVVCGWRFKRHDPFFTRVFSRVSNLMHHLLINDRIHDSGCTLRAYKRESIQGLELYGEMHRYIVSLIKLRGFRISELKVRHRARRNGRSKYTPAKVVKGFLDLWNIWFWQKYARRPLHIFGTMGLLISFFGIISGAYAIYLKMARNVDLSNTFLPVIAVFSVLIGVQFFTSGILADILIKNYHHTNGRDAYEIERVVNGGRVKRSDQS